MFDQKNLSFRKLELGDFSLIHKWLKEPHVHAWYDKEKENTLEEVTEEYTKYITGVDPMEGYIVYFSDKPIGYIQKYKVSDWPEFAKALGYGVGVAAIDIFIGEVDFTGKGFGTMIIKKFLNEIVFTEEGIVTCLIDPEPENTKAIRSYEKAGFKYVLTLDVPPDPGLTYLMEINKPK